MYKNEDVYSKIVPKNYYFQKKLNEIGITKKYNGYYFLLEILEDLVNNSKTIKSYSREIYPEIARKYGKNECSIERDIRSIINVMWDKRLKEKLGRFWNESYRPSCCEFYNIMKDYLLEDII